MFALSPAILWHKSKRCVVKLVSAAQTGFYYVTAKSPAKKEVRMALRKHDPIVNQHVMFYEQKNLSSSHSAKLMRKRSIRDMRLTGKRIDQLVKQEEKRIMGTVDLNMFENVFHSFYHDSPVDTNALLHHQSASFANKELVHAMGMDIKGKDVIFNANPKSVETPVEYILRVDTPVAVKNAEGVMIPTGAPNSSPSISLIGSHGKTEPVYIKHGIRSGTLNEFSIFGKNVGKVSSVELSNRHSGTDTWRPSNIHINRINASNPSHVGSAADGWVHVDANRVITDAIVLPVSSAQA